MYDYSGDGFVFLKTTIIMKPLAFDGFPHYALLTSGGIIIENFMVEIHGGAFAITAIYVACSN